MEKLSEHQQELIKMMSTACLISKLSKAGWSEEEVEKLDRPGLIKAWAELVATGKDHPPAAVTKSEGAEFKGPEIRMCYDPELERKRLEFEMHRWEVEQAEKAKRMDIEFKRLDLEARRTYGEGKTTEGIRTSE